MYSPCRVASKNTMYSRLLCSRLRVFDSSLRSRQTIIPGCLIRSLRAADSPSSVGILVYLATLNTMVSMVASLRILCILDMLPAESSSLQEYYVFSCSSSWPLDSSAVLFVRLHLATGFRIVVQCAYIHMLLLSLLPPYRSSRYEYYVFFTRRPASLDSQPAP